MLSVLEKAIKRQKSTPQVPMPEDHLPAMEKKQPCDNATTAGTATAPKASVIRAEVLDRSRTGIVTPSLIDSDIQSKPVRDIVFIDSEITEIGKLLRELDPQAEVHVLGQQCDGVEQIAARLAEREDILAIHLFCNGGNGILNLGNGQVTADTITTTHSKALSSIGSSLSQGGEIYIYGCDFCSGVTGCAAAAQLSMITGSEVTASADVFSDVDVDQGEADKLTNTSSSAKSSQEGVNSNEPKSTKLSFSVPASGRLDISAENGLLHAAGLIGGKLKSATDGSDAFIKIHEPGALQTKPHILPNGAELTQYTNGAFTYQSEADAGEEETFTCIAAGQDHSLAKFTVSVNATKIAQSSNQSSSQTSGESSGETEKLSEKEGDENITVDAIFPTITQQASYSNAHGGDWQVTRINSTHSAIQLSIIVPDTSAGPIAETTTMVDTPLIFLQRNKNAISISGPSNEIIVLTLTAKNGALCAKPSKGAQVDGYNSANLTISGSVFQINAALDGLRYVTSDNHSGSAELTLSANFKKDRGEAAVLETVAISVAPTATEQNAEDAAIDVVSTQSVVTEIATVEPSVSLHEQSSSAGTTPANKSQSLDVAPDAPSILEFIAPIGSVITIANAGETMKLKEGDLQINRDGAFNFSLREGYTKSSTSVTCCISGRNGGTVPPSEIILNLSKLPVQVGEVFTGNVLSIGTPAVKTPPKDAGVSKKRPKDIHFETANDGAEKIPVEVKAEPAGKVSNSSETSPAIKVTPDNSEDDDIIISSAPVVLADTSEFIPKSSLMGDGSGAGSDFEFDRWQVEEFKGHSLNLSFDRKGKQTSTTPTMQTGQITVDTYNRQKILFLDVNSTFDPLLFGKIESYRIELNNGKARPDWLREIRNGFISIEVSNAPREIELKISAHMQDDRVISCLVKVECESGFVRPLPDQNTPEQFYQREQSQQQFSNGIVPV